MPIRLQPVKHQANRGKGYEDLNTISPPHLCHHRREWTNVGTSAQSTRAPQHNNESTERITAPPPRPRHLGAQHWRRGAPLNLPMIPTMIVGLHLHVLSVLVTAVRIV